MMREVKVVDSTARKEFSGVMVEEEHSKEGQRELEMTAYCRVEEVVVLVLEWVLEVDHQPFFLPEKGEVLRILNQILQVRMIRPQESSVVWAEEVAQDSITHVLLMVLCCWYERTSLHLVKEAGQQILAVEVLSVVKVLLEG
jgi:hypothetical protein